MTGDAAVTMFCRIVAIVPMRRGAAMMLRRSDAVMMVRRRRLFGAGQFDAAPEMAMAIMRDLRAPMLGMMPVVQSG